MTDFSNLKEDKIVDDLKNLNIYDDYGDLILDFEFLYNVEFSDKYDYCCDENVIFEYLKRLQTMESKTYDDLIIKLDQNNRFFTTTMFLNAYYSNNRLLPTIGYFNESKVDKKLYTILLDVISKSPKNMLHIHSSMDSFDHLYNKLHVVSFLGFDFIDKFSFIFFKGIENLLLNDNSFSSFKQIIGFVDFYRKFSVEPIKNVNDVITYTNEKLINDYSVNKKFIQESKYIKYTVEYIVDYEPNMYKGSEYIANATNTYYYELKVSKETRSMFQKLKLHNEFNKILEHLSQYGDSVNITVSEINTDIDNGGHWKQ